MNSSANSNVARDMALIAVFAGIMAAVGLIPALPIPVSPVPITAQTLGVLLAGAILGPRRGALSMVLFLSLVAVGLPLLANGRGGIGVFVGPSVGFLLGWVVMAWFVGFLTYKIGAPYRLVPGIIINLIASIPVLYAFGIVGMMAVTGMSLKAAIVANAWYLIGDSLKAVVAAFVAKGVHSAYPYLLPASAKAVANAGVLATEAVPAEGSAAVPATHPIENAEKAS